MVVWERNKFAVLIEAQFWLYSDILLLTIVSVLLQSIPPSVTFSYA